MSCPRFDECRSPDFCQLNGATCEKAVAVQKTVAEIVRMQDYSWRMALFSLFMAVFIFTCLIRAW